ncbi:MAG TPA: polyprenyl synthetase family protein [Nitrospirota bacterium]
MTITDVIDNYRADLERVEGQIQAGLDSKAVLVRKMGGYILQGGGKRIRPLLLMISANLTGNPGPDAVLLAATVEFIHTASLLHDDVVDEAELRRGQSSANSVWGNAATILVGDYLYSKALHQSVQTGNHRAVDILSRTTTAMSEGEILQLLKSGDHSTTEEEYLEIIERKTAILMSSACRLAAVVGNMPPDKEEALAGYGMDLGLAFQLLDDALDYTAEEAKLGKSLGKDLEEGKLTLPLIHLLGVCTDDEADKVKSILSEDSLLKEDLDCILGLMHDNGSIRYAVDRAKSLIERAKARLDVFPPSPHKDALIAVADFVVEREM